MQLKKPKQLKKPSLKSLKKKLDHAFEMYVRVRDKWTCFTCGIVIQDNKTDMHGGHVITRAQYATRWDERNCFAQCKGCNLIHHFKPHIYIDLYIQKFGADQYHELVRKSHEILKINPTNLIDLELHYRMKLNDLKANLPNNLGI